MVFEHGGVFLLINFIDDFNNREMICHKKSTLTDISKPDITCVSYMNLFVILLGANNRYRY